MNITQCTDIGTTQIKSITLKSQQPEQRFICPTVLAPWIDVLDASQPEYVALNGNKMLVGQDAIIRNPHNLIWGRDTDWLLSEHYRLLHLYVIASQIGKTTDSVTVKLGTTIPRIEWSKRGQIRGHLLGQYDVMVNGRTKPLIVTIDECIVTMQGWTALIAEPVEGMTVWLGLGGRNKTYATLLEDGSIDGQVHHTGSDEGGFLTVVEYAKSHLYQFQSVEMTHQAIINAFTQPSETVVSEVVYKFMDEYIDRIITLINQNWNRQRDMPMIRDFRIGGGGALAVGQQIVDRMNLPQMRVVDDPLWSEVVGLMEMIR